MSTGLRCVHDMFADQAASWPNAPAVVAGSSVLTFAELDARANQLAWHLVRLGAGPEVVIGISLPRSAAFVTAALAVLKSGAAYLPIDPGEPSERRQFIVDDAGVAFTLTDERLRRDRAAIDRRQRHALARRVDPANLAYVIYTSGSTGTPKGVMVPHSSAANYLTWAAKQYGSPGGAPLHSPLNVDLSVTSLFVPLLTGQPVHVLADTGSPADELSEAMVKGGFGFVKLTPAHAQLLGDLLPPAAAVGAGRLVVGGDALHQAQLAFWRINAPGTVIVNEYGPTEATVACCAEEFPADAVGEGAVPIGAPIAGARLNVLDADLRPVADGEAGELCVAGPPVSRGYLGRPGLTAASFVPDPHSGDGGRMYRTGDLVHRNQDGRLVYHGRADDQVKLRGYRIELGEVEVVLRSCPGVRTAAVNVHAAGTDRAALVAHLQPDDPDAAPATREVRRFAAARLPEHSVPTEFRWVDALPLSPNGKIDRARLEDSGTRPTAPAGSESATELEQEVGATVAGLLDADAVDFRESFFALGGNSLLAARLVAGLMRTYQVDLPVAKWLSRPSVKGFAELIETYRRHGREAAIASREAPELDDLALDDEITASLQDAP
jgi:amino acid adenylation domain-containing protein